MCGTSAAEAKQVRKLLRDWKSDGAGTSGTKLIKERCTD